MRTYQVPGGDKRIWLKKDQDGVHVDGLRSKWRRVFACSCSELTTHENKVKARNNNYTMFRKDLQRLLYMKLCHLTLHCHGHNCCDRLGGGRMQAPLCRHCDCARCHLPLRISWPWFLPTTTWLSSQRGGAISLHRKRTPSPLPLLILSKIRFVNR